MTEQGPEGSSHSIVTDLTKKREKKEQKQKKRKRNDDDEEEKDATKDVDHDTMTGSHVDNNGDMLKKNKSKELLKQRRLERQKLLELVPKVDENGISYTKQQIRLMRKRVQKGLHPIETPAEKHNRLVEEARIRKEVEAELAGFDGSSKVNDKDDDDDGSDEDHDDDDKNNNNNINSNDNDDGDTAGNTISQTEGTHQSDDANVVTGDDEKDHTDYSYEKRPSSNVNGGSMEDRRPMKQKKREKPVPSDYVCSACKGTDNTQPPHWIYDCLYKKTMPGTNQVSRKKRGLHDPSETKLFVSGLPFDSTIKDVTELFTSKIGNDDNTTSGPLVVHCKLIKFEDTKRCKGQAFVTFATPEVAKKAMKLNGTMIQSSTMVASSKKAKKDTTTAKELKLKITKVLNRTLTKK
jgi:hypothetical protein